MGLVDVTIVGHMGSAIFIAAIALGGAMFNMLYWLFGFLRMGSSGMTAQAYGAQDTQASTLVLYRSLTVAGTAGLTMILLQTPILEAVLGFMDAEDATSALARRYFSICIFGAPAVLGTYALSGWFLGMQNSRVPMWISIIVNLSNIALSVTLVLILHMEIEGVATGTLIAQWIGFLTGLALCRRYKLTKPSVQDILQWKELKRFFSINADIFLRTLCLVAVTLWFTRVGAMQGTLMLAVNTLLMQFFMLFSFFMDGFAFAGEALCGRYIGARDSSSLKRCITALFAWGGGLAVAFTGFYAIAGRHFLSLLSSETNVINTAGEYFLWATAIPIAGFAAFMWDAVFIGATKTRWMLLSMIAATCTYFAIYHLSFPLLGNHGLWMAMIAYLAMRGIAQTIIFFSSKKTMIHGIS